MATRFILKTALGPVEYKVIRQAREVLYWECAPVDVKNGGIIVLHKKVILAGIIKKGDNNG